METSYELHFVLLYLSLGLGLFLGIVYDAVPIFESAYRFKPGCRFY